MIDEAALRELRSLLGCGLDALTQEFREQGRACIDRARVLLQHTPLQGAEAEELGQLAHRLKGSALSLHCVAIVQCCERLERITIATSLEECERHLASLESCLAETAEALRISGISS